MVGADQGEDGAPTEFARSTMWECWRLGDAASLVLYPSSYEGFGMPVLQAMACVATVIALNNTAFPEFAGGIARLLDDAEAGTLAAGIREVLGNEPMRRFMREAGPRRYLDLLIPLAGQPASGGG